MKRNVNIRPYFVRSVFHCCIKLHFLYDLRNHQLLKMKLKSLSRQQFFETIYFPLYKILSLLNTLVAICCKNENIDVEMQMLKQLA